MLPNTTSLESSSASSIARHDCPSSPARHIRTVERHVSSAVLPPGATAVSGAARQSRWTRRRTRLAV